MPDNFAYTNDNAPATRDNPFWDVGSIYGAPSESKRSYLDTIMDPQQQAPVGTPLQRLDKDVAQLKQDITEVMGQQLEKNTDPQELDKQQQILREIDAAFQRLTDLIKLFETQAPAQGDVPGAQPAPPIDAPPIQPSAPLIDAPPDQPSAPLIDAPPVQPSAPLIDAPPVQPSAPPIDAPPDQPSAPLIDAPPVQPSAPVDAAAPEDLRQCVAAGQAFTAAINALSSENCVDLEANIAMLCGSANPMDQELGEMLLKMMADKMPALTLSDQSTVQFSTNPDGSLAISKTTNDGTETIDVKELVRLLNDDLTKASNNPA